MRSKFVSRDWLIRETDFVTGPWVRRRVGAALSATLQSLGRTTEFARGRGGGGPWKVRSEKRERGRWEWVGGEGVRGRERWGGRRVGGGEIRTGRKEPRRGGPFYCVDFFFLLSHLLLFLVSAPLLLLLFLYRKLSCHCCYGVDDDGDYYYHYQYIYYNCYLYFLLRNNLLPFYICFRKGEEVMKVRRR